MNVTGIIVTRGDHDLEPVLKSLPSEWEVLVYDNGAGRLYERRTQGLALLNMPDLAVYGRYRALDYASNELIYVQDDDCIVEDPEAIAGAMNGLRIGSPDGPLVDAVVCNMPQEFRHAFYDEHALSGFGAAFPRHLPGRTFEWFRDRETLDADVFNRTCDIIFTGLTQRILVDVPVRSLDYAYGEDRMWRQAEHVSERTATLEIVKKLARLDPTRAH